MPRFVQTILAVALQVAIISSSNPSPSPSSSLKGRIHQFRGRYQLNFTTRFPLKNYGGLKLPKKSTRFIVFTTQRTGSGWLMHLFKSQHPYIRATPSEPLVRVKNHIGWGLEVNYAKYNSLNLTAFEFLLDEALDRRCGRNRNWRPELELACGFKVMYSQIPMRLTLLQFLDWVRRRKLLVIHLVRQNIIRQRISKELLARDQAAHRGMAHVRTAVQENLQDKSPLELNITNFANDVYWDDYLTKNVRSKLARHLPGHHIEVWYESLLASPRTCRAMFGFLHPSLSTLACVDEERLDPDRNAIKRQHNQTCGSMVKNWRDIDSAFRQDVDLKHTTVSFPLPHCNNKSSG